MMSDVIQIYIGYDKRETDAYNACVNSILTNTTGEVEIFPLVKDQLESTGVYTRPNNEVVSTDFAFTRFLVPYLSGYEGASLFCDCDLVFTRNLRDLFDMCSLTMRYDDYPVNVMCVNHEYEPKNHVKMDGQKQTAFPRKNWSSLMVFNNRNCKELTPEVVSSESPAYLHQMQWAKEIRYIDKRWNYLVGEYPKLPNDYLPYGIHYTNGGPWFDNLVETTRIDYFEEWLKYSDFPQSKKDEIYAKQQPFSPAKPKFEPVKAHGFVSKVRERFRLW